MMRKARALLPLGGLLAGLTLTGAAAAEVDYPLDTVTLVTHSSPGGGTDVFLREVIKYLGPIMGVDFVVENIRGGSGAKAMAALATAPADGSIFYGTTPTFINTSILSDVEYTYEDLEPRGERLLRPADRLHPRGEPVRHASLRSSRTPRPIPASRSGGSARRARSTAR